MHTCTYVPFLHYPEGGTPKSNLKSWNQEVILSNRLVFYRPSERWLQWMYWSKLSLNTRMYGLLFTLHGDYWVRSLGWSSPRRNFLKYYIPLVEGNWACFYSVNSGKYRPAEKSPSSLRGCGRAQNSGFWVPLSCKHKTKPLEFGEAFVESKTLSSPSNMSLRTYSARSFNVCHRR